jgi:hypothetical protein
MTPQILPAAPTRWAPHAARTARTSPSRWDRHLAAERVQPRDVIRRF